MRLPLTGAPSRAVQRATTTHAVRRASTVTVLDALWGPDPVTGTDLIRTTGLTRATVHDVCGDLIAHGWVEELDDQRVHGSYERGRPARRYGLRARAGVVVGVEAASSRCTAVVTDLLGRVLARAEQPAPHTAEGRRAAVATALALAVRAAGATPAELLSCSVGVPAPVAASGRVEITSNPFWLLMDAGIADHLRSQVPCPVLLSNDADLAALAEGRDGAAAGVRDHITVLADGGFGAGLVVDGALLRGRWGRGGEMRWLDLVSEVRAPIGLGPLLAHWAAGGVGAPPPADPPFATEVGSQDLEAELGRAEAVLRAAATGDARAVAVTDRAGRHLARVVATAAGLLDPEVVVLAGRLAPLLGPLLAVVGSSLVDLLDEPVPRVVASRLGGDVVALGAVQHALDDVRDRAPDLELTPLAASPVGR